MNLNRLLLTVCFTSITAIASAQDKGYYSIGNNAEKLKIQADTKPADSFVRAEKGYYNIQANNTKLRRSLKEDTSGYKKIPVITKGYYSIGNNSRKLREN
jgi:hypothetical protein